MRRRRRRRKEDNRSAVNPCDLKVSQKWTVEARSVLASTLSKRSYIQEFKIRRLALIYESRLNVDDGDPKEFDPIKDMCVCVFAFRKPAKIDHGSISQ